MFKTPKKAAAVAGLALGSALALSGCIEVDGEAKVASDGNVEYAEFTVTLDPQAIGYISAETLNYEMSDVEANCVDVDERTITCNITPESILAEDGYLPTVNEDGSMTITGPAIEGGFGIGARGEGRIIFPANIESIVYENGDPYEGDAITVNGNTVTWDVRQDLPEVTLETTPPSGSPIPAVLGGVLLLAGAGAGAVMLKKRATA